MQLNGLIVGSVAASYADSALKRQISGRQGISAGSWIEGRYVCEGKAGHLG